jgi:hypothetical protein
MKHSKATCMPGVLAAALLFAPALHASTTYIFTGINYSNVFGTFTKSMSLTGTFTLPSALAPNLTSPTTITPTSFSFNDGLDIYDQSDGTSFFEITTGSGGNVTGFVVDLRNDGVPSCAIATQNIVVNYVLGASCEDDTDGLSQHTEIISDANQQYNFGGTPDSSIQGTITQTPEPSTVLSLILGGLAVLASKALGRKKKPAYSVQATCESD